MNLEPLRGAILDEYDYVVVARQKDLVVRGGDLRRKVVSERDLRPAADQLDLADFFKPAVECGDRAVGIHNLAIATASTLRASGSASVPAPTQLLILFRTQESTWFGEIGKPLILSPLSLMTYRMTISSGCLVPKI
jgi:hypothetical protein